MRMILALMLFGFALVSVQSALAATTFGARNADNFQNNWMTSHFNNARTSGFVWEMNQTDNFVFHCNLKGPLPYHSGFESSDGDVSKCGTDTVELFYVSTHGGIEDGPNGTARLALWNEGWTTSSIDWRFGDNGTGTSFFSQYACDTMTRGKHFWRRWYPAFAGGLRQVQGSHETLWDSIATDECGEDYADDLQDGKKVRWAWFDGNEDWWHNQDVAVAGSGHNRTHCFQRLTMMKWQNFGNWAQLFDSDIGYLCWSVISNN